ncbi:hypothetical protein D3C80_2243090 [compost metagenome]
MELQAGHAVTEIDQTRAAVAANNLILRLQIAKRNLFWRELNGGIPANCGLE